MHEWQPLAVKDRIMGFFSRMECSCFEIQVKTTCWLNTEFPPGIGKLDGETWSKSKGEPGFMFLFSFVE